MIRSRMEPAETGRPGGNARTPPGADGVAWETGTPDVSSSNPTLADYAAIDKSNRVLG